MSFGNISIIAALDAETRAIGKDGALLFSLPEDLKRFKALTSGHPVIMGRKTWESLPERFRPLPGRTNIVISRQPSYEASGALVVHALEEAFAAGSVAEGSEEIFIIGGGEIYRNALPFVTRLYLTLVQGEAGGDTYFPEYTSLFTKEVSREEHLENVPPYTFVTLQK